MQDDAENLPMGKPVVILRAEGMFGINKLCCHLFVKILMISNQIVVDIHNQIVVDIHVALHVEKKNDENLECFWNTGCKSHLTRLCYVCLNMVKAMPLNVDKSSKNN